MTNKSNQRYLKLVVTFWDHPEVTALRSVHGEPGVIVLLNLWGAMYESGDGYFNPHNEVKFEHFLKKRCRVTLDSFRAIMETLRRLELVDVAEDDRIFNAKILAESDTFVNRYKRRAQAGSKGGKKRAENAKDK